MVDDWESISPMGEYLRGYDKLEPLVLDTMVAFPDIKLHIVDTFCEGNDIDGYKTTMPVIQKNKQNKLLTKQTKGDSKNKEIINQKNKR